MKRGELIKNMYIATLKTVLLCAVIIDSLLVWLTNLDGRHIARYTLFVLLIFFVIYSLCMCAAMHLVKRNKGYEDAIEDFINNTTGKKENGRAEEKEN